MRLVLVCPYAWEAAGGVQVHVRNLAVRLRERDHQVLVVAPGAGQAEGGVRTVGGVIRIPYRGTVAPIAPFSYRAVRRAIERFAPDLVHVHEPLTPSASMYATIASKAPVVATVHAFLDRSLAMRIAAPLLKKVWRRVTVGVAVSDAAASFLRRAIPEAELEIVPNGVDVRAFAEPLKVAELPPGRRIVWANRLDPQKGFPVAVAAFSRVLATVPDALFVVVGDGKDREALGLLGAPGRARVHLVGSVPNEEIPSFHAACEVYVSAAVGQESFGIALVEAMAAGLPVVSTDIPGYREVVTDGVEGILVPTRDPEALAAGLVRVLTEPELAARLGAAGRERARTLDWPLVVDRLEELYARAIGSDRRPRARERWLR